MKKEKSQQDERRIGFQINLSPDEKDLIVKAAKKEGLPIATYIRFQAVAAAAEKAKKQ